MHIIIEKRQLRYLAENNGTEMVIINGNFYSEAQRKRVRRSLKVRMKDPSWVDEVRSNGGIISVSDIEGTGWTFQLELIRNNNGVYTFEYIGSAN